MLSSIRSLKATAPTWSLLREAARPIAAAISSDTSRTLRPLRPKSVEALTSTTSRTVCSRSST